MLLTCPISLLLYHVNGFAMVKANNSIHPIFTLSYEALLKTHSTIQTTQERQIFLIALLRHYPLLFKVTTTNYSYIKADTLAVIPRLLRQLPKLSKLKHTINLPTFHVHTETINAIPTYLDDCIEALEECNKKAEAKLLKAKEAEATKLLIRSIGKENFANQITNWLFSTVTFPSIKITGANRLSKSGKEFNTLKEYWSFVFLEIAKEPKKTITIPKADLEELYNHIIGNLNTSYDNSITVIRILTEAFKAYEVEKINLDNLLVSIDSPTESVSYDEYKDKPKPQELAYLTKTAYLIELSKWRIANENA